MLRGQRRRAARRADDHPSTRVGVREAPNDEALDRRAWVLDGDRVVERAADVSPALDARRGRAGPRAPRRRARRPRRHPPARRADRRAGARTARGAIVVALSVAPLETLQKEVLLGSLVIAALVLLAGGLALRTRDRPRAAAGRADDASAEDWGAHDLDRRFDLGPPRDELTGLAATLDGLLARIAASRRHEQRFASEVAHELRTPIAGLRGRAELALGADGPDADARARRRADAPSSPTPSG